MILLINNQRGYHNQLIESVIHKHEEIVGVKCDTIVINSREIDPTFIPYIKQLNMPHVTVSDVKPDYDYFIEISHYPNLPTINDGKHFYICHRYDDVYQPNVFYMVPWSKNYLELQYLPFMNEEYISREDINNGLEVSLKPLVLIQGGLEEQRRDYKLVNRIIQHFSHKVDFKIVGQGQGEIIESLKSVADSVTIKRNLSFIDYHKEMLNCDLMLIPVTPEHQDYFEHKMCSAIYYASIYKKKCFIHEKLQDRYHVHNDAYTFTNNVERQFGECIRSYYPELFKT